MAGTSRMRARHAVDLELKACGGCDGTKSIEIPKNWLRDSGCGSPAVP
jgi:hypothetical protein